jgi:hypothetical protein
VPFCVGNIAHGAKVGANHTGRVADQEALIGEGVFFGLGSSVKFPVDLTDSAYTLVAAGTALDPQRCVWCPSLCGTWGGRVDGVRLFVVLGMTSDGSQPWMTGPFYISAVLSLCCDVWYTAGYIFPSP